MTDFAGALLEWYDANKRSLPWRDTGNAYDTWISEIMLQQTRAAAVIPYFIRFTAELPDAAHLAECPADRLMKLWEGLGYYSRARNLQKAAKRIMEDYGGSIPDTYQELLKLEGVGPYTAGAIASIAFGEKVPAVDGNVLRVTARILGSDSPIDDGKFRKTVWETLSDVMPDDRPGDFNQAMMDLGALICVPNGEPLCQACPLQFCCEACRQGRTAEIPVRKEKAKRKVIPLTVLLIQDGDRTLIRKRPETGLLAGLYEFPNQTGRLTGKKVLQAVTEMGFSPLRIERLPDSSHIFTHLEWRMTAYRVRVEESIPETGIFAGRDSREQFAIPSAFGAYVKYM